MWSGSIGTPSVTCWMGMRVRRPSSSTMRLSKSGDRCCSTTNAIPLSSGMAANSVSSASSPPADAPMPTT